MILLTITILALLSCVCIESVLSFSGATHRILSDYAASNSVLNKENYLVDYLGFQNGLQEPLKWKDKSQTVSLWMQDGSELEDEGLLRFFNHFHNPLKEWANAGLNDYLIIPILPYLYPHHVTGKSAAVWALDGAAQNNSPGGDWSWQKTRDLYYEALTAATDEERQQYFAMTFRGLGHQMHLIEDMGVPEHARNDAHPEQSIAAIIGLGELFFEPWAASKSAFIRQYAQNPIPPTVSFNTTIYSNYVPITQLTDTNQYNGSNPSTRADIGLSEYINANFFSDDTIFAAERYSSGDRHYFPYPKESDTDLQDYINQGKLPEIILAWDGVEDLGFWIAKKAGNKIEIEHFLKPTYHTLNLPINIPIYYRTFYRDEKCYEDYVKKLVPRAVGYSAGLLDYFFRGKLDIKQTDTKSNGDIEITITNYSGEPLVDGVFELYYDNPSGERVKLSLNDSSAQNMLKGDSKKTSFTPPTEFESGKNNQCVLVYRGQLGKEKEGVIGKQATLGVEYHWALVFDYPGLSLVNYQFSETPGTWTDCGTIAGAVMIATKTYTCPKTGSVKAYLILADRPIPNRSVSGGCSDNLISMYIGQFSEKDILSKIYYQNEYYDTYWKMTHDPDEVLMCPLRTGEMAYPLASYAVKRTDPMAQIAWREVPIDLPELAKIKTILPASQNIIMAYEGDSFNNDVYGIIQSTDSFSYPVTIFIEDYTYHCHWDLLTKTETEICYCIDYCPPDSPYCFNVVGTVPGSYQERKRLRILIPDTGFEYFFSF
jgi:hypothetical protein